MTPRYDYKKFTVLFVDDEEHACKYFRMAFEQDFHVMTATSADSAWEMLSTCNPPLGVIITDQRMPRRAGTDLLAQVRRSHPDSVRILTTAYADLDAAVEAVNDGAIFKYVVKPWDIRELRMTLRHAMEYFQLRRERDLLLGEKLSSLQRLLIADRVKSLAILAEGLSTQVRDTMVALQAYLGIVMKEFGRRAPNAASPAEAYFDHMQAQTEDANVHLIKLMQSIASATLEPRYEWRDELRARALVEASWPRAREEHGAEATLELDIDPNLPVLQCSRPMLERMFGHLFRSLLRPEREAARDGAVVRIVARETTRVWGAQSMIVNVVRPDFDWGDASLDSLFMPGFALSGETDAPDLLAAFFIAHHHGGTVELQREHPGGQGFRLTLPFAPGSIARPALGEQAVEMLFDQLPSWDALQRGL